MRWCIPFILFSAVFSASLCAQEQALVLEVIDGNTLKLFDGTDVALIGVDAPENYVNERVKNLVTRYNVDENIVVEKGKKSAEFLRSLVDRKKVRLEFDVQTRAKNGQFLAYLYRFECQRCDVPRVPGHEYVDLDDGVYLFVNATLLKSGFARPTSLPPNTKYAEVFAEYFQEARNFRRGLWR